jgi:predicted nucleotidyltransferase
MKTTVEASLLPILRSRGQAEILCAVLANPNREWTLGELAMVSGQSLPTVQREVERAELAALVESRRMGRQRLVKAGPSQIAIMLANLLMWSYGPKFVIAEEFADITGIDRLFIFGSWAARYHGVDGYPPQDLDVLVIGDANLSDVFRAAHAASNKLQLEVNPKLFSHTWWENKTGSGFRMEIERRPIVEIEVGDAKQSARGTTGVLSPNFPLSSAAYLQ